MGLVGNHKACLTAWYGNQCSASSPALSWHLLAVSPMPCVIVFPKSQNRRIYDSVLPMPRIIVFPNSIGNTLLNRFQESLFVFMANPIVQLIISLRSALRLLFSPSLWVPKILVAAFKSHSLQTFLFTTKHSVLLKFHSIYFSLTLFS